MSLWNTRNLALAALEGNLSSEGAVLADGFEHLDRCIREIEASTVNPEFCRVTALALVKARNLVLGCYSLALDGLAQESGALLRPLIETYELVVYLNDDPARVTEAIDGHLPRAGDIAKCIGGQFHKVRNFLNDHASHFSLTYPAVSHIVDLEVGRLRTTQEFKLRVLRTNLGMIFAFLMFVTFEACRAVGIVSGGSASRIAESLVPLQRRGFDLFFPGQRPEP